jgi:hypothetical protein
MSEKLLIFYDIFLRTYEAARLAFTKPPGTQKISISLPISREVEISCTWWHVNVQYATVVLSVFN